MRIIQKEIEITAKTRGFHLITQDIIESIDELKTIDFGFLNVFIKHTSASLTINENADPTVRHDFEEHLNKMVPENQSYYKHIFEGSDDMPAHIKSSLLGAWVQIPITNGKLNMGIWQGIYMCEHRNNARRRNLVITLYGN